MARFLRGPVAATCEHDLEEYLIQQVTGELGGKLLARHWCVVEGLDGAGRGDLVFELPEQHLVVEVKYLCSNAGRNQCVARTQKRRQLKRQAVKYAMAWHSRHADQRVRAAMFTNDVGLVELFYMTSNKKAYMLNRACIGEPELTQAGYDVKRLFTKMT